MKFTQHVVVTVPDPERITALVGEWENNEAADTPGFIGGRLLRFRDKPGRYVIQADFDSWEAAEANNEREETQRWAARLIEIIDGDPKYENLDVIAEF
jgi:quinol monooxygenase YgiN